MYIQKQLNNPFETSKQKVYTMVDDLAETIKTDHYSYRVSEKDAKNWGRKSVRAFIKSSEANKQLKEALENPPDPSILVPIFLGIDETNNLAYLDIIGRHTLVSGQSRSGKTNWINTLIFSLLYFSHPEYLKICIADAKQFSFKNTEKVISIARTMKDQLILIDNLHKEMNRRKEIMKKSPFSSVEAHNKWCQKNHKEKELIPYIIFIFDEFASFIEQYKEYIKKELASTKKDKEEQPTNPLSQIHDIASIGLACGLHLVMTTQAAYSEFVAGPIKNNLERRMSFSLGDIQHDKIILGDPSPNDILTTTLAKGEFLLRKQGKREKYKALLLEDHTLIAACNNISKKRSFKCNF